MTKPIRVIQYGLGAIGCSAAQLVLKKQNMQVVGAVDGTGVRPGFVMATLAVVLTAACQRLDSVQVLRVVDASTRREALRRKIGAGLSEGEFHRLAEERKIGHVGLIESVVFMADAL